MATKAPRTTWGDEPDLVETSEVEEESILKIQRHTGVFDPTHIKILIYGESGTGKTRLASTFPGVIFADIDKGMSSVTETVDSVKIDSLQNLEDLLQFLAHSSHNYETLVIDTLNEMQRVAMHATVEDFPAIRRSYDNLPSQSDYGKMLHDFSNLIVRFSQLPMKLVLLSQVISQQFETDVLQPQLIGKNSARDVCRKMDIIGYIYKSEKEDTDQHKFAEIAFDATNYVTKDRSFKLPAVMTDPTYEKISEYWK